ncbi:DUF1642 domain-containing protein [Enterococcus faecium]|nr:DUF1642 domain-containing protein [Enterococcus faecium]
MNKQELIDKWESKTGAPSYEISDFSINPSKNDMYIAGYGVARTEIIKDLKQLDEPQKPVVPKFVAEWIEYAKKKDDSLAISFKPWNLYGVEYSKADRWIEDNQETFARAWLDGYVEKEPLYMVPLLTGKEGHQKILVERRGEYDIIWDYENEGDWHELLTEEQIKSVNPDYWKLAVLYEPSEEVVEG